jgi:type I restriction-modification system DNA methylase subunit
MALFQTSVLKTYLAQQDIAIIERTYKKYTKYFHNATIQENIKNSKEEQYQAKFLDELFVNVLDYTLNPKPDFNITTEFKNQKGAGKADGAILKDAKAVGVIELKGTNTKDLESIRKQAFDYKANQKGCVYVITSNFEKLRFYINDATEFLEFNLFQLAPEEFALMYLCLQKDNILNHLPLTIKEASLIEEEKITKQFYSDYSVFKRELFRDLVRRNAKRIKSEMSLRGGTTKQSLDEDNSNELKSLEKNVKLSLFKKSQKLIDRFLFIFFAEDRDLLPPNSTIQILDKWKADVDFGDERALYGLFKQYFHFLDQGRKGTTSRAEIYAYNGGLFKPDAILDNLEIDDALLYKHTYKLAKYDFSSQVDVNILGHIFENSLNEIESVNAEIEGGEFDKQKSKRKKDGVFYTPKYITKYIVENTVGKLCQEKKEALGFKEEAYFEVKKGTHQNTKKQLLEVLDNYREWLLQITICDPACGSGAFLNQALDFLIKEHRYIDELKAKVLGGSLILSDIENTILENNIYGVDLNEESVEIAKLSLWLRTAQPRRKLNDLSNNIKCGNSLIDSKAVAGDKAFNWQQEFPQIFEKGGFDVVIGNPPYVRHEMIKEFKPAFEKRFKTYQGTADLYVYFIELGINILNSNGVLGFINPNKFIRASYGKNLKQFLSKLQILQLIDFGELNVFQDAVTSPLILLINKTAPKIKTKFLQINSLKDLNLEVSIDKDSIALKPETFKEEKWNLISNIELSILNKVSKSFDSITDRDDLDIKYGLKTGLNEAFIISQELKEDILKEDINSSKLIKEFIDGDDVRKYQIRTKNKYLICIPNGFTDNQGKFETEVDAWKWLNSNYSGIANYLKKFEIKAKKRSDKGRYWWELRACDYYNLIEEQKIIYPEIAMSSRFALDTNSTYINKTIFLINSSSYSLLGLLNSKLIWFYLINTCASLGDPKNGGRLNMQRIYLETISFPDDILNKETESSIKSKELETFYYTYNDSIEKFKNYIKSSTKNDKLSKKLENWHELDFEDFIKELNKAIKKTGDTPLTKKDEFEWLELFEQNKKKAQDLQNQITLTEKTIDTMVYDLYGLTQEERDIVEGS